MVDHEGLFLNGSNGVSRWADKLIGSNGVSRWADKQCEAPNPALRLRLVVAGFVRYGEMERVGDTGVAFPCGQRHDELVRLTLPYSRNISTVESMMAVRGGWGACVTLGMVYLLLVRRVCGDPLSPTLRSPHPCRHAPSTVG